MVNLRETSKKINKIDCINQGIFNGIANMMTQHVVNIYSTIIHFIPVLKHEHKLCGGVLGTQVPYNCHVIALQCLDDLQCKSMTTPHEHKDHK